MAAIPPGTSLLALMCWCCLFPVASTSGFDGILHWRLGFYRGTCLARPDMDLLNACICGSNNFGRHGFLLSRCKRDVFDSKVVAMADGPSTGPLSCLQVSAAAMAGFLDPGFVKPRSK